MWNQFEKVKDILKKQYMENHYEDGLEYSILKERVNTLFFQNDTLSPARKKTDAIAYQLRNARIDICPEEFFADKVQTAYLTAEYFNRVCEQELPTPELKETFGDLVSIFKETMAITPIMDFCHVAPDWQFLMDNGIPGVINRLREHRAKHWDEPEKVEFYNNGITVFEAFTDLLVRMSENARKKGGAKMEFVADNLYQLSVSAPQTLAQAMQLTFLYMHTQICTEGVDIRSMGGIDRLYAPFYKRDLESGAFTEAQLRELVRYFLWKIYVWGCFVGTPFYICGKLEDGSDATNDFTMVLLEEYRALDIHDPKIHVLYHAGMRQDVLEYILASTREGKNSFVWVNVDVATKALERIGVSPEDAKKVIIYGCYEAAAEYLEIPGCGSSYVNMVKALEFAMFDGFDPTIGKQVGPKTGSDFASFEDFYQAVKEQLRFLTEASMEYVRILEHYYPQVSPSPMFSSTYRHSVEKGVDIYSSGAKYCNSSMLGVGIATLTDALLAVKKFVFEEQKISFAEFKTCLANNWEGYEQLRLACLNHPVKYGNHLPEADGLATEIFNYFADMLNGKPNGWGGVFRCSVFSVNRYLTMGEKTGATPDGRRSGDFLSKNTAAVVGQDKNGVTALLQSLLCFDYTKTPNGSVADIVLHASAVKGEEGLNAFKGLLMAYMAGGGYAVHFNVLDHEILRKAQQNPEEYQNLQIRLCGWNVYFVNLTKQEQDDFITQAEMGC